MAKKKPVIRLDRCCSGPNKLILYDELNNVVEITGFVEGNPFVALNPSCRVSAKEIPNLIELLNVAAFQAKELVKAVRKAKRGRKKHS